MKVILVSHTPEPEKVIASAAKLCYSKVGAEEILEGLTDEKVNNFLDMLVSMGHESPIEHVSFTFAAEGVSRVLTHQLVRHRIASYSQQSQRYVKLDQFEFIMPPSISGNDEAKDLFIKIMEEDQNAYNKITDILYKAHYEKLIQEGKNEKSAARLAEKTSIEDARYVFPNACETKIVFTMNARTLMHFFRHRCCQRAQWEIRELADKMLELVKETAPILFKNAGPNCLKGTCPEGSMSCGLAGEMKMKYLGTACEG